MWIKGGRKAALFFSLTFSWDLEKEREATGSI